MQSHSAHSSMPFVSGLHHDSQPSHGTPVATPFRAHSLPSGAVAARRTTAATDMLSDDVACWMHCIRSTGKSQSELVKTGYSRARAMSRTARRHHMVTRPPALFLGLASRCGSRSILPLARSPAPSRARTIGEPQHSMFYQGRSAPASAPHQSAASRLPTSRASAHCPFAHR